MEIIYKDPDIVVCIKPAGVLSTDEPGGMPELVRQALEQPQGDIRTVHRLDRVVSGLMVLARSAQAAAQLSQQIRQGQFEKEYLAVVHGQTPKEGRMTDLLLRDKRECKTYVVEQPAKGVQEAILCYQSIAQAQGLSRVRIQLVTGRTHQIRAQFSSRGYPLVGDRKYATLDDPCPIALWSYRLGFFHPASGQRLEFCQEPPAQYPWSSV